MPKILIVDDEQHIRLPLAMMLAENGFEVAQAESGEQALAIQERVKPDLILLDEPLEGADSARTLRTLLERDPTTTCLLLIEYDVLQSSIETRRAGAFDYLIKPFNHDELLSVIKRALEVRGLPLEIRGKRTELSANYGFNEIIGTSPSLQAVFRKMAKVAPVDATLLIQGESGTGKELVARAIHRHSMRKEGPFVAVNCAAIPTSLFEAEFFGFEKGAFTDAKQTHSGYFERAHRGTLFLDEVGDLPLESQVKLLRAIENQEVIKLGGRRPVKVNVRVIAATNVNLKDAVDRGDFRQDLYWRLNVVKLQLPSLRTRREDIPLLIDHMVKRFNRELGLSISAISPEAQRLLESYDWPGNVRELENTLCSAMIMADDDVVQVSDLHPALRGEAEPHEVTESATDDLPDCSPHLTEDAPLAERQVSLADAVRSAVAEMEKQMISSRLAAMSSNRTATAESLGISRKSLFNKMRQYGLTSGRDK